MIRHPGAERASADGRSPFRTRTFLGFFLPPALLLGCLVLLLYQHELGGETELHGREGLHLLELQREILSSEFDSIESDLRFLSKQTRLQTFIARGGEGRGELAEEYRLFAEERGLYDQIRYLNEDGDEIIRINSVGGRSLVVPEDALQSKAERYYFEEALVLDREGVYISPFDLNVEHGVIERPLKPVLRFAAPVFDPSGARRGIIVLNYLGAHLFKKLRDASAGFRGSSWLVNKDGYWLRGDRREDEWGFMLGNDRKVQSDHPEAWARISAAGAGQFQGSEGLFTFATLFRGHPLKLVAFEPASVLTGASRRLLGRLLLVFGVACSLLTTLAWFLARGSLIRAVHERRLRESESRSRTLSARLVNALDDERRRISHDLHDDLGQIVTAISLHLQRAGRPGNGQDAKVLIDHALKETGILLERVHEIAFRLRPSIPDDLGLRAAVLHYLGEYEERTGVLVRAKLRFEHHEIPPAVSQGIFRILQEALANVSKHGGTREAALELHVDGATITLTVADHGAGFDASALGGGRLGIPGMKERAELLGGTFHLLSEPGAGTTVRVVIPLRIAGDLRASGAAEDE